jgi:hypothetical protein
MSFLCAKPFTTNCALYLSTSSFSFCLLHMAFFPFESSINDKLCSSTMNYTPHMLFISKVSHFPYVKL